MNLPPLHSRQDHLMLKTVVDKNLRNTLNEAGAAEEAVEQNSVTPSYTLDWHQKRIVAP